MVGQCLRVLRHIGLLAVAAHAAVGEGFLWVEGLVSRGSVASRDHTRKCGRRAVGEFTTYPIAGVRVGLARRPKVEADRPAHAALVLAPRFCDGCQFMLF